MRNETCKFLLLFVILAGKGNAFGANFSFLISSYKRCITPRHASMLGSHCIDERPIYAGNASLVESILALYLRIGLWLVLE